MLDTIDLIQPKIVRVWFDTVLNPIIFSLETEKNYILRNNLTWRSFNSSFEVLKPIQTFFDFRYYANYEQLVEYYSNITDLIDTHDFHLTRLIESCYNLSNEIINSDLLKTLYFNELDNLKQSNTTLSDFELKGLEHEKNLQYITEYIINDRSELDSSYTLSPIWNAQLNNFKNLLNENEFLTLVNDKNLCLENFKIKVFDSLSEFKKIRGILSIESGEPLVMPFERNYEN